eukprot:15245097-Alexandrium_andersonii.AAC.1
MEMRQRLAARSVLRAVGEHGAPAREERAPDGPPIAVARAVDEEGIAHRGNLSGARALQEQRERVVARQRAQ